MMESNYPLLQSKSLKVHLLAKKVTVRFYVGS